MKWESQQLDKVADFRLGKMLDGKKNKGDLMPYLANVNVRWGEFDLNDLREMRFEDHELETFGLRYGDIVMCEGGEPGRCAIWREQRPGTMIQKALHRIRPHACLDHEFLFYAFLHMGRTGRLAPLFTGATIKHLPREKLALLEVPIPPLPIQKRISGILSAYDDLIENNRRRMALLEEAARQLYEEWFVRLRFPGREHTKLVPSSLGQIPSGWQVVRLGDIATKIGSGATPRGGQSSYHSSGVTLIRSLNVYDNRFDDDGLAFLDEGQASELENVTVEPFDILLNITGASVARCCMVPRRHLPARVNQHVMIVRISPDPADPYFVLSAINSDERKRQLLSYAQGRGATREALTKEVIARFPIVLPDRSLLSQWSSVARDIGQQRENLDHQNAVLRAARDLLLPRLMSGEVAV